VFISALLAKARVLGTHLLNAKEIGLRPRRTDNGVFVVEMVECGLVLKILD
jgi:hypothetical protein